jgi:hypothetical protein
MIKDKKTTMGQEHSIPFPHPSYVLFQFLTRRAFGKDYNGGYRLEREIRELTAPCCWDELLDTCDAVVTLHDQCLLLSSCSKNVCPRIESLIPLVPCHLKSGESGPMPQVGMNSTEGAPFFQESVSKPHASPARGIKLTAGGRSIFSPSDTCCITCFDFPIGFEDYYLWP